MESNQNDLDGVEDDISNGFQKAFGWFLIVNKITDNDITKHEYIYEKNIMEVLNQLSFLIGYEQEQVRLQKKMSGKF